MKLEEFKANTMIDSQEHGVYLSNGDGTWHELYPHCVDCVLQVCNEGYEAPTELQIQEPAGEYFGDYRVLALPMEELA